MVSYNACHEYLRRKHPARARLKDRLRYIFKQTKGLDLWCAAQHGWLCGRSVWRDAGLGPRSPGVPQSEIEAMSAAAGASLESLIGSLIDRSTHPLSFGAVVDAILAVLGGGGRRAEVLVGDVEDRLAGTTPHPARRIEHGQLLRQLWSEILQLPQAQRLALLLNLRDGDGMDALELLPASGVASLSQIAETIGMTATELATAWPELPWDDTRIAGHLGLSRQQVVNLRKSARARLGRRVRPLNSDGVQSRPEGWEYPTSLRIVD